MLDADVAFDDDATVDIDLVNDVVDEVDTKHGFGAGWAGATRGGAETVLGGPAPQNRGSLPPNLRSP